MSGRGKSKRSGGGGSGNEHAAAGFEVRVERGTAAGPSARIYLSGSGGREIELTGCVTGAIAHCLWQARGGDDVANWVDAERVLAKLVGVDITEAKPLSPGSRPERRENGPLPQAVAMPVRRAAGVRT